MWTLQDAQRAPAPTSKSSKKYQGLRGVVGQIPQLGGGSGCEGEQIAQGQEGTEEWVV